MSTFAAFCLGGLVVGLLAWITWPRREWTAERERVERCVVEAQLIVWWRCPHRVARWLADRWPMALLPLR